MKKTKVTYRYLNCFISHLLTIPEDISYDFYQHGDPNDEVKVKQFIREYTVSAFESQSDLEKKTTKIDLAYYLTKSENQAAEECPYWINQFESALVPFDLTDDPRVFWIWVWEVYFPDEDYHLNDLDLYEEDHRPRGYPYEITI